MEYDYKQLYQRNADFLTARPILKKAVLLCNKCLPLFFLLSYGWLFYRCAFKIELSPKDLVKILCIPAFTLVFVSAIRLGIDRPRPYSDEGAGILPLAKKKGEGSSFPSRHLTCASVITVVCLPYLPVVGGILLCVTLLLGYCRFSLGWHYLGDLVAGFFLGGGLGSLIFFL